MKLPGNDRYLVQEVDGRQNKRQNDDEAQGELENAKGQGRRLGEAGLGQGPFSIGPMRLVCGLQRGGENPFKQLWKVNYGDLFEIEYISSTGKEYQSFNHQRFDAGDWSWVCWR